MATRGQIDGPAWSPLGVGAVLAGLAMVLWGFLDHPPVSRLAVGGIGFVFGVLLEWAHVRHSRGLGLTAMVIGMALIALLVANEVAPPSSRPVLPFLAEDARRRGTPAEGPNVGGRRGAGEPDAPDPELGPPPSGTAAGPERPDRFGPPPDIGIDVEVVGPPRDSPEPIEEWEALWTTGTTVFYRHALLLPGACPGTVEVIGDFGGDEPITAICLDDEWLLLELWPLLEDGTIEFRTVYCIAFQGQDGRVGNHARVREVGRTALAADGRVAIRIRSGLIRGPRVLPVQNAARHC